jgi:RNA polymerase sigma factor (sigma-70 family)
VDTSTLAGFRNGDADAVKDVYRAYGGLVYAVAYRILGNPALAEDAAQQTFLQAWRAAGTFDVSRDPGPWLATIARRAAIDVHRRESARDHQSMDDPATSAVVAIPDGAQRAYDVWEVRAAVDELPTDERDVVRLQHLEGLTHAEIADHLGIPIGTVKSRSNRAHRRLAQRLGHLREDGG